MIGSRLMVFLLGFAAAGSGFAAAAGAGQPVDWQLGFQEPASPSAEGINDFHNLLLIIITLISVFVLGLLAFVVVRFRESANPTPSKTSHNTLIEVIWTAVPVLILVVIAVPSFRLLYAQEDVSDAEMTIKAIGRQWYWSYEYPDHGNFTFDAVMLQDDELQPGQPRLLATDNAVVLPVDTKIRILVTASDVLHNLAVPALGLKMDGVPGRINETWVEITREGTYYGQCSELCGAGHSYMPIMIEAVSKDAFEAWVKQAQEEFAGLDTSGPPVHLAAATD